MQQPQMEVLNNQTPMMNQQPVVTQSTYQPAPVAPQPAPAASNPFDFDVPAAAAPVAQPTADLANQMNNLSMMTTIQQPTIADAVVPPPSSMPPPPSMAPPVAPPSPQQEAAQAPFVATQTNTMQQAPLSPNAYPTNNNMDPFALSPVPLSPQVQNDPFGYAFSPMTSPVTSPNPLQQNGFPDMPNLNNGAIVPTTNTQNDDPFGVFGGQQQQQPPVMPAQQNSMVQSDAQSDDPFGVFGGVGGDNNAVVLSAPPVDDPFGLFGAATPAPATPHSPPTNNNAAPQSDDPWAAAGFGQAPQHEAQVSSASLLSDTSTVASEVPIELDENYALPKSGDYYEARINARSLGAMFYTARDLEDTLLYKMPTNVIDSMKSRPVVAYVAENSAAFNAGVHLGHVVLSVNGHDVTNPDECAAMIRNASRPMNLRCYVMPELDVTMAEGKHLVKYDVKDMEAPTSTVDWKMKYVVVGGIVAKPWMVNMYYSKKDYDTAVKETHSNFKCSVKVKQFDLRGARIILKGKDGKPNVVSYHSEPGPWHYITILPEKGYPIKISAEKLEDLEPVYAAVRRFVRKDMEARFNYERQNGDYASERANARAASSYAHPAFNQR